MKNITQRSTSIAILSSTLVLFACGQNSTQNTTQTNDQETVIKEQRMVEQDIVSPKPINAPVVQILEMKAEQELMQTTQSHQVLAPQQLAKRSKQSHLSDARYVMPQQPQTDNENYSHNSDNPINLVSQQPVSTFSIDVDSASYSNVRRILNQGSLPQPDAVRVEEMVNYFSYQYPQPTDAPFSVYKEVGPSPYNEGKHLIHIGIQGEKIINETRPSANLVFLIDVSGSMNSANKLGLLKNALIMLSKQLNENDNVAIVVYAGAAGTVLAPTAGDNTAAISDALQRLSAGGSTNGAAGIELAYRLAQQSFVKGGINRVILATDGDFNVGTVNQQALKNKIEKQRESGVSLSILGFGRGNYNDALMQELAQNGNGNAFYIDTLNEARKVLVEELSSTLFTIAKDVKIQIEFNPDLVSEYRLIGYETRALKREDFNNDKVDAGDIGAGHTVTAIYEITLVDSKQQSMDPLRYESKIVKETKKTQLNNELAYLKLRYKLPAEESSKLIEIAIKESEIKTSLQLTSNNYQFSAAVAGFAQLLRGANNLGSMDINKIISMAQNSKGEDKYGYRSEFINMVKLADALAPQE
jgi:Ca-activated chloride channel family protein